MRLRLWLLRNIAHRWGIGFQDDFVCVYCGRVCTSTDLYGTPYYGWLMPPKSIALANVSFAGLIVGQRLTYPQVP